jgi:homoserine kinase
MAVYTDVTADDLNEFLSRYDIGALLAYKGIAEGVENSNFLVHTASGNFILTLYEKRVAEKDLPFFLALMEHLAARGITCPQPVKNKNGGMLGRLAGRPAAIVTFLDGLWIRRPTPAPIFPRRAPTRWAWRAGVRSISMPKSAATACATVYAQRSPKNSTRWRRRGRAICRKA